MAHTTDTKTKEDGRVEENIQWTRVNARRLNPCWEGALGPLSWWLLVLQSFFFFVQGIIHQSTAGGAAG